MNANDDLERRIADYYADEVPPRAPDWVLGSALATTETTTQRRRVIRLPRRFAKMNGFTRLAIAAVVALAIGGLGLLALRPAPAPNVGGVGAPSPSAPAGTADAAGSTSAPSAPPALTGTFVSPTNGISVSYPSGWTVAPAVQPWTTGEPSVCDPPCADRIVEKETDSAFLGIASQPLGDQTGEEWAAGVLDQPVYAGTCPAETEPYSIDGQPGMVAITCPERLLTALTWAGGRGYFLTLYRVDDVDWFKEILATVRLHPEDAVDAAPAASN